MHEPSLMNFFGTFVGVVEGMYKMYKVQKGHHAWMLKLNPVLSDVVEGIHA